MMTKIINGLGAVFLHSGLTHKDMCYSDATLILAKSKSLFVCVFIENK